MLQVEPSDRLTLNVTGPFAESLPGEGENLAMRAARLLAERGCVTEGATLTLVKNLPIASGLGA